MLCNIFYNVSCSPCPAPQQALLHPWSVSLQLCTPSVISQEPAAAAAQLGHSVLVGRSNNGAAISQRAAMSDIIRGDGGATRVDVAHKCCKVRLPFPQRRLTDGPASSARCPVSSARGPASSVRGPASRVRGPESSVHGPTSSVRGPTSSPSTESHSGCLPLAARTPRPTAL